MKKLSRRSFIKGAAAAAALTAAGGVLSACTSEPSSSNSSQEETRNWDMETDVLILGAGGAGMCAGYEAAKAGAKVLILEKSGIYGGTSIRSAGIIQASGTDIQKQFTEYQDDTPEKHAEYYLQEGEGMLHEDLVKDMTANSASHIAWLQSLGIEFTGMSGSAHVPMADESIYADRIHKTDVGAPGIFSTIHDAAADLGVEFVFNTEATKLVVENGKVVGAEAIQDDKTISVKANKAVIIATSGIDHNLDMSRALSPNQYYDIQHSTLSCAPSNTGDGIRMGAEIGAQLSNFGGVIGLTATTGAGTNRQTPLMPCFFVNKYGRRFTCEDNTYSLTARELWREMMKTNHSCYTICSPNAKMDKETLDAKVAEGTAFTADTIEALAEQIDVDAQNLKTTLEQWNKDISETGADRQFDRFTGLETIDGPFYAFEEGFTNLGAIGGLLINLDAQVLTASNEPIPGLYAAGMASAGWLGGFYPGSGTALLGAIHWGRRAGQKAAAL